MRGESKCSLAHQNSVTFYQVMAADAAAGFTDMFRRRMIQKFTINEADGYLHQAEMVLDTNDSCKISLLTQQTKQESMPSFHVSDIGTEMDYDTTWRLRIQGLQTPKEEQ